MTPGPATVTMAQWRPMRPADLPTVNAIAQAVHPDYPEPPALFAERLALFPAGCAITQGGYAIAHPIRIPHPPALASLLHALPPGADGLHLHDVALLPDLRGRGAVRTLLARLHGVARQAGLPHLCLVAVHGTAPMWSRLGFRPTAAAVASYGPDAQFMLRPI